MNRLYDHKNCSILPFYCSFCHLICKFVVFITIFICKHTTPKCVLHKIVFLYIRTINIYYNKLCSQQILLSPSSRLL